MARDYITYNELLNQRFNAIGFRRKNRETFVKKKGNAVQELLFGHATYYMHHVRFYDLSYCLDFPIIEKFAKVLGVDYTPMINNVFFLIPGQTSFKDWRVDVSDNEDFINKTVNDICQEVEKYAVPFLDKYSDLDVLLDAMEKEQISPDSYDYVRFPAIAYCMLGNYDKAIEQLHKKKQYILNKKDKISEINFEKMTKSFTEFENAINKYITESQ